MQFIDLFSPSEQRRAFCRSNHANKCRIPNSRKYSKYFTGKPGAGGACKQGIKRSVKYLITEIDEMFLSCERRRFRVRNVSGLRNVMKEIMCNEICSGEKRVGFFKLPGLFSFKKLKVFSIIIHLIFISDELFKTKC